MASICNDERGSLGAMSGHERKTLTLLPYYPLSGSAVQRFSARSASLMPSLTPTSAGSAFKAA